MSVMNFILNDYDVIQNHLQRHKKWQKSVSQTDMKPMLFLLSKLKFYTQIGANNKQKIRMIFYGIAACFWCGLDAASNYEMPNE